MSSPVFMPSPLTHVTGLYGIELLDRHGATFTIGATPFQRGLTHHTETTGRPLAALCARTWCPNRARGRR